MLYNPQIDRLDPAECPASGEIPVMITGALLQNVTSVTFGSIKGTITKAESTKVACIAPAGPEGTVQVLVKDSEGNPSNNLPFTYLPPPA